MSIDSEVVDTYINLCIMTLSITNRGIKMKKTQEEIFAICKEKEESGLFRLSLKDGQLFECCSIFGEIEWSPHGYYTTSSFCKPTFGPLPDGHTPVSFAAGRYL